MFTSIKRWIIRGILGKQTCSELLNALHYSKYKYVQRGDAKRASDVEVAIRKASPMIASSEIAEYIEWKFNGEQPKTEACKEAYKMGLKEGYANGCLATVENIRENFDDWAPTLGLVRTDEVEEEEIEDAEGDVDASPETEENTDNAPSAETEGEDAEENAVVGKEEA
nr:MAG TPA: hypothetical protein [Caudoviricetes sp.]